jgi:hypothetical protein
MKRRAFLFGAAGMMSPWMLKAATGTPGNASALSAGKRVFAHYMVAWPRGGPHATIDDYIAEFRDAQRCGIDGFSLNCGGWHRSEPLYRARVLEMYRAAAEYEKDFKLFVSADGNAQNELGDIIDMTGGLPAQLSVAGRPVLSAYALGGRVEARREALMMQAKSLGAYFVPHFAPSTGESEIDIARAKEVVARSEAADGYFYFGAAGAPDLIARSTERLAAALRTAGKVFMAPVTPYYRGLSSGTNNRVFETGGFSGMATEWLSAIKSNADWVQIVTWNDWAESTYVAPIGASTRAQIYDPRFGALPNHDSYLNASRYFNEWFKRGNAPTITCDALYYFYRLHPVRGDTQTGAASAPRSSAPLTANVHVTTFLEAPATLEIIQGAPSTAHELPAGYSEVAVPAYPGKPRFRLSRNGCTIADKTGEEAISLNDFSGAFNYFSGTSDLGRCRKR